MSANSQTDTAASGTPEDFEGIVARYESQLLRYTARILNDPNVAQDIVQRTFIKLFRMWKPGAAPSPQLSAWLYRVAHNAAVDHIRSESRRHVLFQRHAEEQNARHQHTGQSPVSEAAEHAALMLKKLSLREQQLVILKVYEEKSYREISEITGLSEGNVGFILHHAMKKLAALVGAPQNETTETDQ